MHSKFNYYDIMAVFLPGSLMVGMLVLGSPEVFADLEPHVPKALVTYVFVALTFVIGQILHSTGSFLEPFLFWTWGGEPSERILQPEDDGVETYLPQDMRRLIRERLNKESGKELSGQTLFLYAMSRVDTSKGRIAIFNSLYGQNRSLFAAALVACPVSSGVWPLGSNNCLLTIAFCMVTLLVTLLFWSRTRARAFYYVREVVLHAFHAK